MREVIHHGDGSTTVIQVPVIDAHQAAIKQIQVIATRGLAQQDAIPYLHQILDLIEALER